MYFHIVKQGETLFSISEDYRTPISTLIQVNQITNPNLIFVGQPILIPSLPDPNTLPYTINVSLSQKRLTVIENGQFFKSYPIAVGRILKETPVGEFVIINKAPNPGGPFGTMWMSLSKKHYGIHGTDDPTSIGKAVSSGCIRMFNRDVEELASIVPVGTKVTIQP
ncbi:L,D-transpeptidase family protein [Bacillus shivajii]|uniref:L,D-transpeptidase family protein n=1 Tax=Bacillus shivajii TaxID=1983719 RepID=UPI001CFB4941|nr:L,D-transpeptidase family protein [Bacillus shivajii]UCZ55185.1 L,D-transpeptidase family protein [Bacillus shivajii]